MLLIFLIRVDLNTTKNSLLFLYTVNIYKIFICTGLIDLISPIRTMYSREFFAAKFFL
jgi:hypothetical protein